jgi:hypothetical protein
MKRPFTSSGYSLVEVTLVLGVAVFCLIAILGDYSFVPVAEIQPTPGVLAHSNNRNIVAIQSNGCWHQQ